MTVKQINSRDFEGLVLESSKPVMVDFYADWCAPCKMAAPILEKLAQDFGEKIEVIKVDVDESTQLAQKYQVMSIPTVIIFQNGKETERKVGFPGEAGYREMIEKAIK